MPHLTEQELEESTYEALALKRREVYDLYVGLRDAALALGQKYDAKKLTNDGDARNLLRLTAIGGVVELTTAVNESLTDENHLELKKTDSQEKVVGDHKALVTAIRLVKGALRVAAETITGGWKISKMTSGSVLNTDIEKALEPLALKAELSAECKAEYKAYCESESMTPTDKLVADAIEKQKAEAEADSSLHV